MMVWESKEERKTADIKNKNVRHKNKGKER
jgi:hypothetical protein